MLRESDFPTDLESYVTKGGILKQRVAVPEIWNYGHKPVTGERNWMREEREKRYPPRGSVPPAHAHPHTTAHHTTHIHRRTHTTAHQTIVLALTLTYAKS